MTMAWNCPLSRIQSPSTWTTIEDDIVLLWVSQVSHASSSIMSSPSSRLQSGVFHIKLIR